MKKRLLVIFIGLVWAMLGKLRVNRWRSLPFISAIQIINTSTFTDANGNQIKMEWFGGSTNCLAQIGVSENIVSVLVHHPFL